jgi:hypothetical protein
MTEIAANIISLKKSLPSTVRLVAVSKTKPVSDILDHLPPDIEWHLIGHLQRNKVKYIASFISMIQSVDSQELLATVDEEAGKAGRVMDILLQVYIAREETKSGFVKEEIEKLISSPEFTGFTNVRICGLMGMATFTSDMEQVRMEFRSLAALFNYLKKRYFSQENHFREISMGMSGDFETAVIEGSTMVRIGSLIFGKRMKKADQA